MTAASNWIPTLSSEASVLLCSIAKTHSSPAMTRAPKTGPALLHSLRPANCTVSIRRPTLPMCSPGSSISGPPLISMTSCPGTGRLRSKPNSRRDRISRELPSLQRSSYQRRVARGPLTKKDTCPAIYSLVINSGASLKTVLRARFPWCVDWKKELRKLFAAYAAAKQQQNVLDYDDLLSYWAEMMSDLGEVEARLNAILLEVRCSSGKVILLIDDMHELTGGDNRANTDATSTLKAALDDGRVWYCGGCPSAPGATCSRSCAKGR
jgi:hypothetical protein